MTCDGALVAVLGSDHRGSALPRDCLFAVELIVLLRVQSFYYCVFSLSIECSGFLLRAQSFYCVFSLSIACSVFLLHVRSFYCVFSLYIHQAIASLLSNSSFSCMFSLFMRCPANWPLSEKRRTPLYRVPCQLTMRTLHMVNYSKRDAQVPDQNTVYLSRGQSNGFLVHTLVFHPYTSMLGDI